MRNLIVALLVCSTNLLTAQNTAVSSNEKLVFTAAYNMSGIMTDLAEVTMETQSVKTSKATLLHLKCKATTYSKWDNFFKIRDLYESYVSPTTLKPYMYKRDINEGGYYKFMQYKFKHKSNTVESLKRKRRKDGKTWDENKNISIGPSTIDIITTIYQIRTLNLDGASAGKVFNFTVIFDNEEHKVSLIYKGKETISTAVGRKSCHKLAIAAQTEVIQGSNNNLLWLTADANKIPVYAKFKIPVGNGELKIKSASGLLN
ncbi:DUF3108 domain-containing protein [Hanstruepera marina]|uniref:DUF3108 domain-containing protein n=1 Tax=Hanstruepera marina TaxID=2873265 RepID=UPI001CA6F178|nr:DUF3108 domain-containing protein [Hanstruepera marina]